MSKVERKRGLKLHFSAAFTFKLSLQTKLFSSKHAPRNSGIFTITTTLESNKIISGRTSWVLVWGVEGDPIHRDIPQKPQFCISASSPTTGRAHLKSSSFFLLLQTHHWYRVFLLKIHLIESRPAGRPNVTFLVFTILLTTVCDDSCQK